MDAAARHTCRSPGDGSVVNGVRIDPVDPEELIARIDSFLSCGRSHVAHFLAAHPTVEARDDRTYREVLNAGDLNVADGMPVALAARLGGNGGRRLPGTDSLHIVARWGLTRGLRHYLYGATEETLARMRDALDRTYPGIQIVGTEAPPFRAVSDGELDASVEAIRASEAEVVWIGIGAPKQDLVAARLRDRQAAPVIMCVGAAFDFVAGVKRRAPEWMQRAGLEWLHRLLSEPRRLWRRYLVGNTRFLIGVGSDLLAPRRDEAEGTVPPGGLVDVIAIAGTGQNGATLASRLLGEMDGWVAVGEVARLWDKALVENVECSCGEPFRSCPFWTKVGEVAFGGWDALGPDRGRRLVDGLLLRDRRAPRILALPSIVFPGLSGRHRRAVRAYAELTHRLFRGILEVSGGRVVLDSSKWPAHVYALSRSRGFRARVVHLVRDARGVAYSNTKRVLRQGSRADRPFRVRQSPWKVSVRWLWINLSSHALRSLGVPVESVRYESLVADPRAEVARIARFAGSEEPDLSYVRGNEADLSPGHMVAGNRIRLARGTVQLDLDDEWRSRLPAGQRRLVTLLTWPLLWTYGYVGRGGRSKR